MSEHDLSTVWKDTPPSILPSLRHTAPGLTAIYACTWASTSLFPPILHPHHSSSFDMFIQPRCRDISTTSVGHNCTADSFLPPDSVRHLPPTDLLYRPVSPQPTVCYHPVTSSRTSRRPRPHFSTSSLAICSPPTVTTDNRPLDIHPHSYTTSTRHRHLPSPYFTPGSVTDHRLTIPHAHPLPTTSPT